MVIHYLQREGVLVCLQDLGRQEAEAARDPALLVHCKALQHPATHCNTLQHTATHCNTL